jgi:hypothetical protein
MYILSDLSWQTSLAGSAIAAAEDVREAVRTARTAASAKAATQAAAFQAQTLCETGTFSSIDEARTAQTRSSMAHSHAIHAAVVDHEAKTVKRRATLALAHDVKCWNVHRKREMLRACLEYSRAQHEATRRAVDAWSTLRDGFVGRSGLPVAGGIPPVAKCAQYGRPASSGATLCRPVDERPSVALIDLSESGLICDPGAPPALSTDTESANPVVCNDDCSSQDIMGSKYLAKSGSPSSPPMNGPSLTDMFALPFATAEPIAEGGDGGATGVPALTKTRPDAGRSREVIDSIVSHRPVRDGSTAGSQEHRFASSSALRLDESNLSSSHDHFSDAMSNNQQLSVSMHSLIDGLMTWGGGFDDEDEDHFNLLPPKMAANIVLETGRNRS